MNKATRPITKLNFVRSPNETAGLQAPFTSSKFEAHAVQAPLVALHWRQLAMAVHGGQDPLRRKNPVAHALHDVAELQTVQLDAHATQAPPETKKPVLQTVQVLESVQVEQFSGQTTIRVHSLLDNVNPVAQAAQSSAVVHAAQFSLQPVQVPAFRNVPAPQEVQTERLVQAAHGGRQPTHVPLSTKKPLAHVSQMFPIQDTQLAGQEFRMQFPSTRE